MKQTAFVLMLICIGIPAMARDMTRADIPADAPRFEAYAAQVYAGPQAAAVRRLTENSPVNFAGQYVIVTSACGGGCMNASIVNVKTGAVASPDEMQEIDNGNRLDQDMQGQELDYRADSNLIRIVRGGSNAVIGYYTWNGRTLQPVRVVRIPN